MKIPKIIVLILPILQYFPGLSQVDKTKTKDPAYRAEAFHLEGGLRVGTGSFGMLNVGFTVEPKYATEQTFEFGLEFSMMETADFPISNVEVVHGKIIGILPSVGIRDMSKAITPYLGLQAGVMFVKKGGSLHNPTQSQPTSTEFGIEMNFGIHLAFLKIGGFYTSAGAFNSRGFHLGLNF